jgi:hypothetical protein
MKDNVIKILEVLKSNKVHRNNVEETVVFSAGNELIKDISWIEMKSILSKLDKDKIINIESLPYNSILINSGVDPDKDKDKSKRYYKIKLLKGFDDYIQKRIGIPQKNDNQVCLYISYSDNAREVLLNDIIILSKPNYRSTNDLVFRYLYSSPNTIITKSELGRELSIKRFTKSLHEIVRELGFEKELRTIFFKATKTTIIFRNPITKQHLIDLGHPKFRIKIGDEASKS